MALVLFALVLSSNVWGEEVILMNCSNFNPALKNNNYGDYNGKETDFTIGGGEIEFTGQDLNMNPNNTPTGFWKEQFLQMKKTSGHIQSKTALNLVSLKIVSFSKDFTVTAGTSLSALSEVTASETTQKTTINLYNSSDKTKPSGTQEEDLTVSTYNLSGKNYFKIANGSSSMSEIYSIEVTYSTGSSCTNKVTVTKGAATGGSYTLKAGSASGAEIADEGTVDNCDANATIVVVPNANSNYHCTGVTASNSTSVTGPDGSGNYTITYTQGSSISSTINVTFAEDTKYTISFQDNIQLEEVASKEVYGGATFTFPDLDDRTAKTEGTCEQVHYHFMGWVISTHTGDITDSDIKTGTSDAVNANATYKAVWAAEEQE